MSSNIVINHAISYDKEIVVPKFDTVEDLNNYTPARAGALAQVGTSIYNYNGTKWIELNNADSSGATLRGDIPE